MCSSDLGLQDGITKEFELLVVTVRTGPGAGGGMGEGALEEIRFAKGVTKGKAHWGELPFCARG